MTAPGIIEAPSLGTRLTGGYELRGFLGAGGMGAVYEAVAPDGTLVAVKLLLQEVVRGDAGAEMVLRFEREAAVISAIANPHVVALRDTRIDSTLGVPFLVMPRLVGLDLRQLMRRVRPLHPTVAVRVVRQACQGLQAAHDAEVIHRDIKPANLFLDHEPTGRVTVRVLDFGIAKWARDERRLTQTGEVMGSPAYMAPEQTKHAAKADARADVWSLAAVLYHALAGRKPFAWTTSIAELYVAICTKEVPALQQLAPWLDPELAAAVHRGLVRDLALRCPSMRAFAESLLPFAGGTDWLDADLLEAAPPSATRATARGASPQPRSSGSASLASDLDAIFAAPREEPDPLLGQLLARRYTLLRQIGRGGMGAVYEARGLDGLHCAVKVIDPKRTAVSATVRERFVREAEAVVRIQSEHVVRVFEAGSDEELGVPFIAMELLHGEDLGVRLQRDGPLMPHVAARVGVQASEALAAAHALGLVHRDIKPSNLYLQSTPTGEVVVKICDFGVVKQVGASEPAATAATLTQTGTLVGSPAYVSPEQAKGSRELDRRTDVWSLGISLYEALAGVHPWEGRETVGEMLVAICTEEIRNVQDRAPWVPTGLAVVVRQALRRPVTERYQSVEDLAQALAPFTAGTAQLSIADFRPVPEAAKTDIEPRTSFSGAQSRDGTSSISHGMGLAQRVEPTRRRWSASLLGACAAGVLGAAGLVGAFVMRSPAPPSEPSAGAHTPTASGAGPVDDDAGIASSVRRQTSGEEAPATAHVLVDGAARPDASDPTVGSSEAPRDRRTPADGSHSSAAPAASPLPKPATTRLAPIDDW